VAHGATRDTGERDTSERDTGERGGSEHGSCKHDSCACGVGTRDWKRATVADGATRDGG
jgi:hypothetical protein